MSVLSRYLPVGPEDPDLAGKVIRHALFFAGTVVSVIWIIQLIGFEFGLDLTRYGVHPRDLTGLRGILFSPLIHAGFDHLLANTLPLLILTVTLFYFYRGAAYLIFFLIYLLAGILLWIGGRDALHIGASGVIYGLAAFLFLGGLLSRQTSLLTISLLVAMFYGSLIWGILPVRSEISWEGHLWGGLSGFLLAFLFRAPVPPKTEEEDAEDVVDWTEEDMPVEEP
ncbi:MAG: rhomboid family intramembrane serine protease [Marinilabiliales bacterium]|nr:rhomboid family intramembrane serine protease [Marinilabiliales bacterium]